MEGPSLAQSGGASKYEKWIFQSVMHLKRKINSVSYHLKIIFLMQSLCFAQLLGRNIGNHCTPGREREPATFGLPLRPLVPLRPLHRGTRAHADAVSAIQRRPCSSLRLAREAGLSLEMPGSAHPCPLLCQRTSKWGLKMGESDSSAESQWVVMRNPTINSEDSRDHKDLLIAQAREFCPLTPALGAVNLP